MSRAYIGIIVPAVSDVAPWLSRLARHAARRARGLPVVSTLVGPPAAAWGALERWLTSRGALAIRAPALDVEAAVHAWAERLAAQVDLPRQALEVAARALDVPVADLRERVRSPAWERAATQAALAAHDPSGVLGRLVSAEPLADLQAHAVLDGLGGLLPLARGPWLGLLPGAGEVTQAAALAGHLVRRAPGLPVVVVLAVEDWRAYAHAAGDAAAAGLLREGHVRVSPAPSVAPDDPSADRLAALGIVGGRLARFREVQQAVASEDEGRARSAAERFLFDWFEAFPPTSGLFELNGKLADPPRRALEVDLLARRPRIALEIDGYHHFTEPSRYRRDQEKNYRLAKLGYLPLRFLAEDVVARLEHIRDRVLHAVAWRTAPPPSPETPS